MSGQAAASGFEYQFLTTLSFALRSLLASGGGLTGVIVDAPISDDPRADPEIVDFALLQDDRCGLAAQVKGGAPGSTMSAVDATRVLLRLLTHEADRYALITNRRPSAGLLELIKGLRTANPRERIVAQLSRTPELRQDVLTASTEWSNRLARVRIIVDDRSTDELRTTVREQVRAARRKVDPESVGWDAAGLLTGYLVAEVLAKAADPDGPVLTRAALEAALRVDRRVLQSLMLERDWAVPLTPTPRVTDIARPEILELMGRTLHTPVTGDSVPVCVLTGLSGIGKTGVATAWAEDRADAYAIVIWVEAATTAQIEASFAQAAASLAGTSRGSGQTVRDVVRLALARSARPWLIVFDNAPSLRAVADWLPASGIGHVVVTTVDPTTVSGPHISTVVVGAMTEDQALALLAARLLPNRAATNAESTVMRRLAVRLQHWPLALELAATYLNDCLGGLAGTAAYESLVMRSLDDDDSIPHGYPHTLVQAIQISWQRMVSRRSPAEQLAVQVLRRASLLAPRKIPLHVLLSACLLEPRALLDDDVVRGPRVYGGEEPSLGEVVRAMRRQSLVITDTPLWNRETRVPPDSTAFTIGVNEIVQSILREDLHRVGDFDTALTGIAFHIQYWLSFYMDEEKYSVAMSLLSHAITAAEHALRANSQDYSVALLLGNTARMLDIADIQNLATQYLRAEMRILNHSRSDQSLLLIQTAANLASVLYHGTERPRDAAEDIAEALEQLIAHISLAYEADQEVTAHTVRVALTAATNLIHDGRGATPRIENLRIALEQYCTMMPTIGRPDLTKEVPEINMLIKSNDYHEALSRINDLINTPGLVSLERTQLFRLRLECLVWSGDWEPALRELQLFIEAAATNALRAGEAADVSRNVAVASLMALTGYNDLAATTLDGALTVADHIERNGGSLQAHDKVVIDLFRCLRAVLSGNVRLVRNTLAQLDLHELAKQPLSALHILHSLLGRWAQRAPYWTPNDTQKASGELLSYEDALNVTRITPLPSRPLMAAAVAQACVGVSDTVDSQRAAAIDLMRVLELMGFDAEVIRTSCTLRPGHNRERVVVERDPHHVVFSKYFGRLVDPGAASIAASTDALPDPPQPGPTVLPMGSLEHLRRGAAALTAGNVLLVYQGAALLTQDLAERNDDTTARTAATPFIIALKAAVALAATGDPETLISEHPALKGLIPPGATWA